jgi:ActR/RegA family two-component response regulator
MNEASAWESALSGLTSDQLATVKAVKAHAERLLDHSPRFKYFTLHGHQHLNSLFQILGLFREGGIKFSNEELFVLAVAICIHDLGMVVSLRDKEIREILDGRPGFPDATTLENFVRERHHELIDIFFEKELGFLVNLGLAPTQIGLIGNIARCHRRIPLSEQTGLIKDLGSVMRVIDELDIGAARAPADVFLNLSDEMDATSCWHWFKHNIVDTWMPEHNVSFVSDNNRHRISFTIIVRPTRGGSIDYWLTQIQRPIVKALRDDGAQQIIRDRFGVRIDVFASKEGSRVNNLGKVWQELEEKALSSNRKVVLVIDDENRKLEDLFLPLMDFYHVIYAYSAKDAFSKLEAGNVDLAIVDLQIASGGLWTGEETNDFKSTGLNICAEIRRKYSKTKVGVLTGTRYPVNNVENLDLSFFLRKPIDPRDLTQKVQHVLDKPVS